MTAADHLADAQSASRPATGRRRTQPVFRGADLIAAWRAGAEILAGTGVLPATRPRRGERDPVQCDQCPQTWPIGDSQAETRLGAHQQENYP